MSTAAHSAPSSPPVLNHSEARDRARARLLETANRWKELSGCDIKEIALTLGVDESTLHRWRAGQSSPSAAGEERLWTLKELVDEFEEMFGSALDDGYEWLRTRVPSLGHKRPLDVLRAGHMNRVLALLGRANRGEPAA